MKIRLKGDLHPELRVLGIHPEDEFDAWIDPFNDAAHFAVHRAIRIECVVWPDNYEIC